MPQLHIDNWIDVDERAALFPQHFEKPDNLEIIEPKYMVKISNIHERFFVEVTKVFENGVLHGIVSNVLVYPTAYNYGDHVQFHKRNVFQTITAEQLQQTLNTMSLAEQIAIQSSVVMTPSEINKQLRF